MYDAVTATQIDGHNLLSTVGLYAKRGTIKFSAFDESDIQHLVSMYRVVLGVPIAALVVPRMFTMFQSLEIAGQIFGSRNRSHASLSHILAKWTGQVGKIVLDGEERPGQIQHFVHHRICCNGTWHDSLLAVVLWSYRHEMKNRFDGVTLWCANHHEDAGPSTYMPVQRIASLFCPAYDVVSESQVMFPCPLSLKLCL